MFSFLKNHPFAVEAFFESSVVLTFAVPKDELQPLIPPCLQLDSFDNKWGFIAIAVVQTRSLRPKGFPAILGNDFFLVGYRIFTRYTTRSGKNLRGLYILKSVTNRKRMEWLGNCFTRYSYSTTDIIKTGSAEHINIHSMKDRFEATIVSCSGDAALPTNSPFTSWKEARRFAGPLPFTFSFLPAKKEVLIIEGVRQFWNPEPVSVSSYRFPFLEALGLSTIQLASAFMVKNIPYYWKKGQVETWQA